MPKHIGDIVTGLMGSVSQARWNERVAELLQDFAARIEILSEEVLDVPYYGSEEFQALLIEAVDQERTNRFVEKRKMLAAGLARSGTGTFRDDPNKETFLRTLRDLTLNDHDLLRQLEMSTSEYDRNLMKQVPSSFIHDLAPPQDSQLRRLEGLGLLRSRIETAMDLHHDRMEEMSQAVDYAYRMSRATRILAYSVSEFGLTFLAFLRV